MAARPTWKGYLKISLVNIPVKVFPATDSNATLSFNQLHAECQTRIQQKRWCPQCQREVPNTDIVKGFEFEKGRYVVVGDEDIDKVRVDSTRVINLEQFTDDTAIDPIYLERPYYLAPDGEAGQDVYAVLHEAIAKSGKAALARVVIARRERAVAILPMKDGMVLHTLHEKRDINDPKSLFDPVADEKPDSEMVKLAEQLIDRQAARFEPTDVEDHYEARLREVIAAKLKGEGIEPEAPRAPRGDNVVDLMAALKQSLGRAADGGRKEAPAKPVKTARAKPKAARKRA